MPFDQALAERARILLLPRDGYDEKRTFAGMYFLLACGVFRDQPIVPIGPQAYGEAPAVSHVA